MSAKKIELIASVIRNHVDWYGQHHPVELAEEIVEALDCHATFKPLNTDEIEHVRKIVFPSQTHPDDIQWAGEVVHAAVTTADILRSR